METWSGTCVKSSIVIKIPVSRALIWCPPWRRPFAWPFRLPMECSTYTQSESFTEIWRHETAWWPPTSQWRLATLAWHEASTSVTTTGRWSVFWVVLMLLPFIHSLLFHCLPFDLKQNDRSGVDAPSVDGAWISAQDGFHPANRCLVVRRSSLGDYDLWRTAVQGQNWPGSEGNAGRLCAT